MFYIKSSLQKHCSVLIQPFKCSNSIRELQSRCFSFSKRWNCKRVLSGRLRRYLSLTQVRFSPKGSADPSSQYTVSSCAFFSPSLFYSACFERSLQSSSVLMKGDSPQINRIPGTAWFKQTMVLPSLSQALGFLLFGSASLATVSLGQLKLSTM